VVPADPAVAQRAEPHRAAAAEGEPAVIPPPLPRRHSQTHLAPQLQFGPPPPLPDDDGGHDPALMASFLQGVSRSETGTPTAPAMPAATEMPAAPAAPATPAVPGATEQH
jgi:hypothetical protein